jgi:uncharacterized protein YkwD
LVPDGWWCEIIAVGYPTHRAALRAWLGSPQHRRCLLEPRVRRYTAAYRKQPDRLWVVHLR